jgi:hypothetical protein
MATNDPWGWWNQLLGGGSGIKPGSVSAGASSTGMTPYGGKRFDFSNGIPAALLSSNAGLTYDPYLKGGGGFESNNDASNANSAAIKFGTHSPTTDQGAATLVPTDVAGRLAAGGGQLEWDSLHKAWTIVGGTAPSPGSRGGPNYGASPLYSGATQNYNNTYSNFLENLNKLQGPIGTPALNQFNTLFGSQSQGGSQPVWQQLLKWGRG